MGRGRSLSIFAIGVLTVACGIVSGIDDYELADGTPGDAAAPDSGGGSSGATSGGPVGTDSGSSSSGPFRREITLSSDAPGPLTQHATLVVIPPTFEYSHTQANGDDLRFSATRDRATELPYFIESWTPGGASYVWVLVPNVPLGVSAIHLFYGDAFAGRDQVTPQSNFDATFPRAMKSTAPDGGTFSLPGNEVSVDWFELQPGHTLRLASETAFTIKAERLIIAGTIDGKGAGRKGGSQRGRGNGPGGGGAGPPGDSAGGGGYGGKGGRGGDNGAGGGGNTYGTADGTDIELGSGGGGADHPGANGGGAITLIGWRMTVNGTIHVDGSEAPQQIGNNAGGGSGGGILMAGAFVDLAGGTFTALGGAGESCVSSTVGGGGGGGGGRIKSFHRPSGAFLGPQTLSMAPGPGGSCGAMSGIAGEQGTAHAAPSPFAKGVESLVGPEETP